MNLDSKPSAPDPPNTSQVIESNDETETAEKLLEDYYKAKINHNHTNFHMIQETVKEELRHLNDSINLFNKSKLPYSSTNYLFTEKVARYVIRQRNDKYAYEKFTPQVNNYKPTKIK